MGFKMLHFVTTWYLFITFQYFSIFNPTKWLWVSQNGPLSTSGTLYSVWRSLTWMQFSKLHFLVIGHFDGSPRPRYYPLYNLNYFHYFQIILIFENANCHELYQTRSDRNFDSTCITSHWYDIKVPSLPNICPRTDILTPFDKAWTRMKSRKWNTLKLPKI